MNENIFIINDNNRLIKLQRRVFLMIIKDYNDLINVLDIDDSLIVDLCLFNGSTIFNKEYNTNNAYLKKHIALKLKKS